MKKKKNLRFIRKNMAAFGTDKVEIDFQLGLRPKFTN